MDGIPASHLYCSYKVVQNSHDFKEPLRYFGLTLEYNVTSMYVSQPNSWLSYCLSKDPAQCTAYL
jgi:hypothetical protein